ncbi:MAG: helix-turn-helix transcriptional regulator [Selenomonas ruminantium]|nr:helix-turn-helix transcriptional regulator [Selenomonas ruminantium]
MAMHCDLSTMMGRRRCTIEDLHKKTGLSRNTISNLYHDKPARIDYDTIEKLCDALECSISELFILDKVKREDSHAVEIPSDIVNYVRRNPSTLKAVRAAMDSSADDAFWSDLSERIEKKDG